MKANILHKEWRHPYGFTALPFPDGCGQSSCEGSPSPRSPPLPTHQPSLQLQVAAQRFHLPFQLLPLSHTTRPPDDPPRVPSSSSHSCTSSAPQPCFSTTSWGTAQQPSGKFPLPLPPNCQSPAAPTPAQQPLSLETPESSPQQSSSLFIFISRLHPLRPRHQSVVSSAPVLSFNKTEEAGERPFPQSLPGLTGLPRGRSDPRSLPTFIYVCVYIYIYLNYGKIYRA